MRSLPPADAVPYHRGMRNVPILAVLVGLSLSGCGLATYEQRLEQTADYFEYHQMLNDNLASAPWSGQLAVEGVNVPLGVSMRIPLGYSRLPGPQPITDPNDENVVIGFGPETRHPLHLGIQLPGIVDAWEKQMPSGNVRLYVLGNYDLLLQQAADAGSVDPTLYFEHLNLILQQGFGVGFIADGVGSPTDDNRFYSARFPAVEQYQPIKDFNAINIAPPQPIEGIEWRAQLYEVYEANTGPVRVAILCIFPAEERANVVDVVELALETLTVGNQAPQRPDAQGGGGGGF